MGGFILFLLAWCAVLSGSAAEEFFRNPVVRDGADPWVVRHDGMYYFTSTRPRRVEIIKSKTLAGLSNGVVKVIWRAPQEGPNTVDIWAPEFHRVGKKWWVYFSGSTLEQRDFNRRIFALESKTEDLRGEFMERGKVSPPGEDFYAIDGHLFQHTDGKLFFLWSGRETHEYGPQNIYIAAMKDPATISSRRVRISTPEFAWEKEGWAVNEGPEVLEHNGRIFVVYSASGFTSPRYGLGLLVHQGGDLLDPKQWKKLPEPVFQALVLPEGGVYGPGHNGFFKSPDGKEHWIIYHGRDTPQITARGRSARAQRFGWSADGLPIFGKPLPSNVLIPIPSGEVRN